MRTFLSGFMSAGWVLGPQIARLARHKPHCMIDDMPMNALKSVLAVQAAVVAHQQGQKGQPHRATAVASHRVVLLAA
jgi:hypothetical protein